MKFLRWTMSQAGAFGSGGGGGGGITTINGDTGNTGTSTTPTIYADNAALTCGSTVQFTGDDTSTLTLNVTDSSANIIIGLNAGNASLLGDGASYNTSVGAGCFQPLTTGNENCALGYGALNNATTSNNCVSVGFESMITDTSSEAVVAVGNQALYQINGASYTIGIGYQAGGNYSGTESNNIAINALSTTVTGENGVLRIGDGTGTGQQQLQAAYISGIDGVALTTANVVTEVSDQLGTAVLTPGSGITIDATSTPNQIIISASGGGGGITTINGDTGNTGTSTTPTITVTESSAVFTGDDTSTLTLSFTYGTQNTYIGSGAGNVGTSTGSYNTGFGYDALDVLTSGNYNCALGRYACGGDVGDFNTGVGYFAGQGNTGGASNTSLGAQAYGVNTSTGSFNTCIGYNAAAAYNSAETGNILLNSIGVSSESNVLRICDAAHTTTGSPLSAAYIGGITGVSVTGAAVIVAANDQLGVTVSSRKYKDNIQDMGDASNKLYNLRPTTFNYKGSTDTSYGLIAEEVAEVMPNLVVYDKSGDPQTVMYHELPALLLNEIQKLRKEIDELKGK